MYLSANVKPASLLI